MGRISIIGGGPAGLRAAEIASAAGAEVTLFDAKPSVGRKFLIAGKGGLNLTHGEDLASFVTRYRGPDLANDFFQKLIGEFTPQDLRAWAADLGVETFQASSGRVYPKALKAAPLLRRWVGRLKENGTRFEMNHRLARIQPGSPIRLEFGQGASHETDAVILALGGGSWPNTGSDGSWTEVLTKIGVQIHPLQPANCGWEHAWPDEIVEVIEGQPLKNIHVRARNQLAIGELMLTRYGLEGGAIYQLGHELRSQAHPAIAIDFKPTFDEAGLISKLGNPRKDFLKIARSAWKLSDAAHALLSQKDYPSIESLAREVKHHVIPLTCPRPIEEAISSAGGIGWSELNEDLMLKKLPGLFAAGEMIDWEAPTGGYLMQGCFATGTRAAHGALAFLRQFD
ncbi:TIGR03862 family flavoprotein [Luteolibacter pohnpeiensis]|uniref:TIGR03862 family flavoprotein n=1 Tax=Luteolibacter pohnpeiensis TaxID=454153 RepID=A0A934S816_9BACT|nr:TIGR03862 family flavoprotein [Luteolibacter pohnpeiensis]MBK1881397.1 TIGR03862 family flavoprotein [Luteolibacter pohnpeiensis]